MDLKALPTPIAIVGAGLSGRAAQRLLLASKIPPSAITIFDQTPGKGAYSDPEKLLSEFRPRTLVVSPGVPLTAPWIRSFEGGGGLVTSELELACAQLNGESLIGVTGSVGKSTTVSLLGAGVRTFCLDAFVGGNLGTPLAEYIADVLEDKRPRTQWVILELSSFQLERARNLACAGAAVTSLTGNHLERYDSLDEYYATKWKLVKSTYGPVVLNARSPDLKSYPVSHPVESANFIWASREFTTLQEDDFESSKLLGLHNRDNLAVAHALAVACEWPASFMEGMLEFTGLPHRLQFAGSYAGIRFVNDSKATAIDSVLTAVESLMDQGPLVLLLGGKDKNLPWERLNVLKSYSDVKCVFFGACGALAAHKSGLVGPQFGTLREALPALKSIAVAGDTVLFSPGGTSLDEFKNFEERGHYFARTVKELFS